MESEETLVKSAQSGDKTALETIIKTYYPLVFSICNNICKNGDEALNLTQDVFVQVFNSIDTFRGGILKAWICRIATNKAIDWKRKASKVKESFIDISEIDIADKEDYQVETIILKRENDIKLHKILKNLPEIYQSVIQKYYFASKSYVDISKEENISVKTVESRLYRARSIIREKWEGDQ